MSMVQTNEYDTIRTRYAENLEEVYQHVHDISNMITKRNKDKSHPIFWYRGHEKHSYNLAPNIFRSAKYQYNENNTYSNNHLREDYRFQSFMARNYDNIHNSMPQAVIEWQEIMQHYFVKTRLMDWSESLTIALEFALEAFLIPYEDMEVREKRKNAEPSVWILQPDKLNKKVYDAFIAEEHGEYPLIRNAFSQESVKRSWDKKIGDELKNKKESGIYYDLKEINERNINLMISLSSLEVLRNAYRGREEAATSNFELNPFFYLLLRYYSDGIPVVYGMLPPLAIIHPYHSERIRMQKGVFTVFPYYIMDKMTKEISEISTKASPFAMEYMNQCIPYLYEIRIMNPQRVADELIETGCKRGNLYPEMQIISQDFENVSN